jgi:hypothetical protein
MAGKGSRFGYKFKPFLKINDNETFIDMVVNSFMNIEIECVFYFIFTKEQEEMYTVSDILYEKFKNLNFNICILEEDTYGPFQTIKHCIKKLNLKGKTFICDCDHFININPMISFKENYDILIPLWNIEKSDFKNWSKVTLDISNNIVGFHEKEIIDTDNFKGIIGCYLFNNIENIINYPDYINFSSMFNDMILEKKQIKCVTIKEAYFFGTPEQLYKYRLLKSSKYTLFIDIDGTLVSQDDDKIISKNDKILIKGTLNKLNEWKKEGHTIVLTTSSNTIPDNIPYDYYICNLPSGSRIVINDKKPYLPFYDIADGISIKRNDGISNINLDIYKPPEILYKLKGGSFSEIFVVKKDKFVFVRKYIYKTDHNKKAVNDLKKQYEDMKNWKNISPNLVPEIFNCKESKTDFYFDMEYLENYDELYKFDEKTINTILTSLIKILKDDIYVFKRKIKNPLSWINTYMNDIIYPKFRLYNCYNDELYNILNKDSLIINNIETGSIYNQFKKLSYEKFAPEYEGIIHGDLTLNNILYNKYTNDFKIVDISCSRQIDAIEIDVGRLFQSFFCEHYLWYKHIENVIKISEDEYKIPESITIMKNDDFLIDLYGCDKNKCLFFMITYLFRMVPYLINIDNKQALLSILLCRFYLKKLN